MTDIRRDDVVVLKSGGPPMTVSQRGREETVFAPGDPDRIWCIWFDGTRLKGAWFHRDLLEPVEDNRWFRTIWGRMEKHQGEAFETISGLEFAYEIDGGTVTIDRSPEKITRDSFAKVLELVPLEGPGNMGRRVAGIAYIWAILHDGRIRLDDY